MVCGDGAKAVNIHFSELIIVNDFAAGCANAVGMSRIAISFFKLLVLLSVVSLGWVDARGMALPSDGMAVVICAEGGAKTVTLDDAGNAVEQRENAPCTHCPECLPTFAVAFGDPVAMASRPMRLGILDPAEFPVFAAFDDELRSHPARAPPSEA